MIPVRNASSRHLRASAAAPLVALVLLIAPLTVASAATPGSYHVVNRSAHISFYVPVHFAREAGPSFFEEDLWNSSLSIEIFAQDPHGEVSVSDERAYLAGWLADNSLKIGKSKYVDETFGRVASVSFSYLPSGFTTRFVGVELRFVVGARSYDLIVDAPVNEEVTAVADAILASWGT
jgi:hypothetical protein